MNTGLIPFEPGEVGAPLWEVGLSSGVDRPTLRARLGEPHYVETDSSRTFGGEEDWWAYRTPAGGVVAVCLRVPYREAVLCANTPAGESVAEAVALLHPWPVELIAEPRLR